MIGQQMMAVLVAFLLIASTSCFIILVPYFSALPVNKKNLVTRWAIKNFKIFRVSQKTDSHNAAGPKVH